MGWASARSRVQAGRPYRGWWPTALEKAAGKTSPTKRGWLFISPFSQWFSRKYPQIVVYTILGTESANNKDILPGSLDFLFPLALPVQLYVG